MKRVKESVKKDSDANGPGSCANKGVGSVGNVELR